MIPRHLTPVLHQAAVGFPVISLTGPRQSGKSTLAKTAFPKHAYVTLEDPAARELAIADPKSFLWQFTSGVVIDEAQYAPQLFSHLQVIVDQRQRMGEFVLTGSHNFLLMQQISQSLAGRCAVLHLLPFSLSELCQRPPLDLDAIGEVPHNRPTPAKSLLETLYTGSYPPLYDRPLIPDQWLASYTQTYLDRDVRLLQNVGDLGTFMLFLEMCAGRTAQLLNLSSLAADCGITHTTARRWLSILETSFLTTTLRPYHGNLGKRLVKSPKLYFLDCGLLCYLLRIRRFEDILAHPLRGAIFETFVVSELLKNYLHRGKEPDLFFWRDQTGHEVDLLVQHGSLFVPIEVKAGMTIPADADAGLQYWASLAKHAGPRGIIYGGDESYVRSGVTCLSWRVL